MSALWTGEALAAATGGELTPGCAGCEVDAVSIDTRTLAPRALFVALAGENGDGHRFLADAFARGAAAALVHDAAAGPPETCRVVVADTRAGLEALGRAGRARFGGRAIGVTGSVGKTTTKEMLRVALGALGAVHAAEASHNNHWGVPLTLARLPRDADFAVCEIGMNHPGEIAPLAAMVRPDAAIVTAIGTSHVGHMGSIEAIAREKGAIFGALAPGGLAVLPAGGPGRELLLQAVPLGVRVIAFGEEAGAEARLVAVADGRVEAEIGGATLRFALAAPGRHMARNAVAVLAAVHGLGLDVERAAAALDAFRPGPGRGLARPILGGRATLLDESYNASTASVRAALEVLALLPAARRLAVLGDMLELGDWTVREHAGLAGSAAEAADLVYACGPGMRHLFDALPDARRGAWAPDAAALAPAVADALRPGDAILVKGSNGSRMRLVVDTLLALDQDA